jgi:hypothetical protein
MKITEGLRGAVKRVDDCIWEIPPEAKPGMLVPARLYASGPLLEQMDDGVFEQVTNVACLPGIVRASLCMPDAHWGYGFPIGGVAAFRAVTGVISPAGSVRHQLRVRSSAPTSGKTRCGPVCTADRGAVRLGTGEVGAKTVRLPVPSSKVVVEGGLVRGRGYGGPRTCRTSRDAAAFPAPIPKR